MVDGASLGSWGYWTPALWQLCDNDLSIPLLLTGWFLKACLYLAQMLWLGSVG